MTSLQKVIKYGAIALGFYLVFVIISAIIFAIVAIFGVSVGIDNYKKHASVPSSLVSFDENFDNVNNLDIDLNVSRLNIKIGNDFRVDVSNSTNEFYCRVDGDTLKIKDKRSGINWFNFSDEVIPEIVLYIPESKEFNKIEIEAGVNETYIEKLIADRIEIETGVGKFTIDDITADVLKISGGAGESKIGNSKVDELKLDSGVGKFVINSEIAEEANIEAGVGQLIINLQGHKDNYKVKASTGLGSLLVDGKKVEDNQVIGDGKSYIKVEAGVGEVRVNFLENI